MINTKSMERIRLKDYNYCRYCDKWTTGTIKKRRLNTMYEKDELNWQDSCYKCYKGTVDMYSEQWKEYYSMCC